MTSRRKLLRLFPALGLLTAFPTFAQRRDRPARIALLDDAHEDSRKHQ